MEISTYVGSSAGSIISTYLAAGFTLENVFNSFLGRAPSDPIDAIPKILPRLTYATMFKLRPTLIKEQMKQVAMISEAMGKLARGNIEALLQMKWIKFTGLFSTAGLEEFLREEVLPSNHFQDYAADLFLCGTQLNHSRKVVFGKYSYQPPPHDLTCQYNNDALISDACAASTALPIIYAPYPIRAKDGNVTYFIDGEIRETLSTHVAVDAGADLVIASYTHQPYHYQESLGSLTQQGLPTILIQAAYLLIEQKINHVKHYKQSQREALLAVEKFCKQAGVAEEHRKRIIEIMETELHHRLDVDTIYIHPRADDIGMFFGDHFTLSPRKLATYVKAGFRAAIDTLRQYHFADKKEETVVVSSDQNREHA
jgi:predicted acylesterase/phospholipase RssA